MPWGGVLVGKGKQVVVAADEVVEVLLRVDGPSGETTKSLKSPYVLSGRAGFAGEKFVERVCGWKKMSTCFLLKRLLGHTDIRSGFK